MTSRLDALSFPHERPKKTPTQVLVITLSSDDTLVHVWHPSNSEEWRHESYITRKNVFLCRWKDSGWVTDKKDVALTLEEQDFFTKKRNQVIGFCLGFWE